MNRGRCGAENADSRHLDKCYEAEAVVVSGVATDGDCGAGGRHGLV